MIDKRWFSNRQIKFSFCAFWFGLIVLLQLVAVVYIFKGFQGQREDKIEQYEQVIKKWNKSRRDNFESFRIYVVEGSFNQTQIYPELTITEKENNLVQDAYGELPKYTSSFFELTFSPMQINIAPMIDLDLKQQVDLNLLVSKTSIQEIDNNYNFLKLPKLSLFKRTVHNGVMRSTCEDDLQGYYNDDSECVQYWVIIIQKLIGFCAIIQQKHSEWKLYKNYLGEGCSDNMDMGFYEIIPLEKGQKKPSQAFQFTQFTSKVRAQDDPYLKALELTAGQLDFGLQSVINIQKTWKILGCMLLILSSVIIIQPVKIIKSQIYRRSNESRKQIKNRVVLTRSDNSEVSHWVISKMGGQSSRLKKYSAKQVARHSIDKSNWYKQFGYLNSVLYKNQVANSISYLQQQEHLSRKWAKHIRKHRKVQPSQEIYNEKLQKQWKLLIRQGAPDQYIRLIILNLFGITRVDSYQQIINQHFQVNFIQHGFPKTGYCPTFTEHQDLMSIFENFYLSDEGLEACKRVLWVINQQFTITYSPLIPIIAQLLLIYLSEEECFEVLKKLIQNSQRKPNEQYIRWHFTLNHDEFGKLVQSIDQYISSELKDIGMYFVQNDIDSYDVIRQIFQSFFLDFFPLTNIIRILICFLSEGTKILYRVIYTLFKTIHSQLIEQPPSTIILFIKQICQEYTLFDELLDQAFKAYITHNNNKYSKQTVTKLKNTGVFIVHHASPKMDSTILDEQQCNLLWSILPNYFRLLNPTQVYSSDQNGLSLQTLISRSEKYPIKTPMLFLMQCHNQAVIGFVIDCCIQRCKDYIGGFDSMVFRLLPDLAVFNYGGLNQMVAHIEKSIIIIGGGGEGPALSIDAQILNCTSMQSETFMNYELNGRFFQCIKCELWALQ